MKKNILLVTVLFFLLGSNTFISYALTSSEDDTNFVIENTYIRTITNKTSGRFAIKTVNGSPLREEDSNKKLLFMELTPETSYTTFRINNKDFIYGNDYNFQGMTSEFLVEPKYYGTTSYSKWRIGDVYISQYLILENEGENAGDIRIKYEVENRGKKTQIGARILLDTMIGENDGSSILVPDSNIPITNEKEFLDEDIPSFWYSPESVEDYNVIGKGTLETGRYKQVDRFVVAHWEGISRSKFDYKVDQSLNFTSDTNKFLSADSAVGIYFNEKDVDSNTTTVYQTVYGIGDVTNKAVKNNNNHTLYSYGVSKSVDTLDVLTDVDEDKNVPNSYRYSPNPFQLTYYIDNTYEDSKLIENISFDITNALEAYNDIFKLVEGEENIKSINRVEKGEIAQITYNIEIKSQGISRNFEPFVNLSVNRTLMDRISTSIIIPKLEGMQETAFLEVSPRAIFSGADDKSLSLLGEGFNYIGVNKLRLTLIAEDNTKIELLADINSDREISASIPSDIAVGFYDIEIIDGEEVVRTFEKGVEITSDETLAPIIFDELVVNEDFKIKGKLIKTGLGDNETYRTESGVKYLINDYIKFEGDLSIVSHAEFFDKNSKDDEITKIEGNGKFYIDLDLSARVPTTTFYEGRFRLGYFEEKEKLNEQDIYVEKLGLKALDTYNSYVFRDISLDWPLQVSSIIFNSEVENGELEQNVEVTGALLVNVLGIDLSQLAEGLDALDFAKIEKVQLDTEGVYFKGGINIANPVADYGIGPFQTPSLGMTIDTTDGNKGWGISATAPMPIKLSKATGGQAPSIDSVSLELEFVNKKTLNKVGIAAEGAVKLGNLPAKLSKVSGAIENIADTGEMPTEVEIGADFNDTLSPMVGKYSAVYSVNTFKLSDSYMRSEGKGYCYIVPTSDTIITLVWDKDNCKAYDFNGLIVTEEARIGSVSPWVIKSTFNVNADDFGEFTTLEGSFTGKASIPDEIPLVPNGLEIDLGEAEYKDGKIYAYCDAVGLLGVTGSVDLKSGKITFDTKPKFIGEFIIDAAGEVKDGAKFLYENGVVDVLNVTGEAKEKAMEMAKDLYETVELGKWTKDGMEVINNVLPWNWF